jgi:hypothetical protein
LPVIAVIGLVLSGPVEGNGIGHAGSGNPAVTDAANKPNGDLQPSASAADVQRIASALEAISQKPPSADEKRNADAEEWVAWWTPWIIGIAFLEILITAGGVVLVGFTLHHTKRAADAAEKTLSAMIRVERPYLWAENFEASDFECLSVDNNQDTISYMTTVYGRIKNCGSRLAIMDSFAIGDADDELPVPIAVAKETKFAPRTIGPGAVVTWPDAIGVFHVRPEKFEKITSRGNRWYIFGHFRYHDAHNISRRAGFAFIYSSWLRDRGRCKLEPVGPAEYWYDVEVNAET